MGPDLWAFIVISLVVLVLLVVALCGAASGADDALEEWARDREKQRR